MRNRARRLLVAGGALLATGLASAAIVRVPLRQAWDLETPAGWAVSRPATREHPWTRSEVLEIEEDRDGSLRFRFLDDEGEALGEIGPVEPRWVLPHLAYRTGRRPDPFDGLNLMLAEFSRLGVQLPMPGRGGEPTLARVTNNCLESGYWEVSLLNEQGRLLHGWFDFPEQAYRDLVARAAGLPEDFVAEALTWRIGSVKPRLERLRKVRRDLGKVRVSLDPSFVFEAIDQEQVKKKTKSKWKAGRPGRGGPYPTLADLEYPVRFADFIAPGRYTPRTRRSFHLGFLRRPTGGRLRLVEPRTRTHRGQTAAPGRYLEVEIDLGGERLLLGNLPLDRLAAGEDMRIHGFGAGVHGPWMEVGHHQSAERSGRPPTYAYLLEGKGRRTRAANTHERGVETLDLHLVNGSRPRLEVIVGSFERMTSLVRYRVELPPELFRDSRMGRRTP